MTRSRPSTARGAPPLTAREFARRMAGFEPFEPRPLLAVAVSGGADSMALALLAHEWARRRRGRVIALTVDHGLRPDSREEALSVARWMRPHGIAHRILCWAGVKPESGLQAAARAARYRMLSEACKRAGILHLLLAHNRDDQAETVLLRLSAGTGAFGLAAMPALHETASVRLLRPLLGVPHALLAATLASRGQEWIEDPSNRDTRFARVRVREALADSPGGDIIAAKIARAAVEIGRFRAGEEHRVAELLARTTCLFPEGHALIDGKALAGAPPELGWRALAAVLAAVGGLDYLPEGDAVRRLLADLAEGRRRTLAGCRLAPNRDQILVTRELRNFETLPVAGERLLSWDRRFAIAFAGTHERAATIAALGAAGWAEIVGRAPWLRATALPYPVRIGLPALRDGDGVASVPALGYSRGDTVSRRKKASFSQSFRPPAPLARAAFAAGYPA